MRTIAGLVLLGAALSVAIASTAWAGAAAHGLVVSADRLPAVSGEIYRVDPDGHRQDLSRSPYQDTQALVSPDGSRVAFVSDRSGHPAVYVIGVDGHGLKRISGDLEQPSLIAWSPQGDRLLAVGSGDPLVDPSATVLYLLEPGRSQRAVVRDHHACLTDVTWSPTGGAIAYATCDAASAGSGIRVVAGSGQAVFQTASSARSSMAVWSADSRLAVLAGGWIKVFDDEGGLLARFPGDGLAWSRSGRLLATIKGGIVAVRAGGGAGRVVLRRRLFPAGEIQKIVKAVGAYEPELLWVGERHVGVGNVRTFDQVSGSIEPSPFAPVSGGIDVRTGRRWRPSAATWYAGACECVSRRGGRIVSAVADGTGFALRISRVGGGEARTVLHVPGCWSDGGFVASAGGFQFGGGGGSFVYESGCEASPHLYAVAGAGAPPRRASGTDSEQTGPAISPDGRRVAYVSAAISGKSSAPSGTSAIWAMDSGGGDAHALTAPGASTWDTHPSWSPDGTQVVFARATISTSGVLDVVPASGGAPRPLHIAGGSPAWGPQRIAYLAGIGIGGAHISLWTAKPDGRARRKLATGYLASPAWSQNGRLAYLVTPPGGRRPNVVVVSGTHSRRFALPFAAASSVLWSPDGTRLAIVARVLATSPWDVYSVDPAGQHLQRLTRDLDVLGASWRP